MPLISELFWNSGIETLKKGYLAEDDYYICLLCNKKIEKGLIYQYNGSLYEAEKFMKIHIASTHQSVFEYLVNLDKKLTGLSEHQKNLLQLFYQGKSDSEIQDELGIGSSSTIRNHRFVLKEKEHQARIFLVLMELLKENSKKTTEFLSPHKTAKMIDDRYKITSEEETKIILKYFTEGPDGPLKTFDMKEKSKIVVLSQIVKHFSHNRVYSEKQVNEILKSVYPDFATIRRYLIEYGFMDREPDCSEYWLKEDKVDDMASKQQQNSAEVKKEVNSANRRKELIQQYKEIKIEAGVYQVKNQKNGKVLIQATADLKTMATKRMQLLGNMCRNKQLQDEWNQYGEDAFSFEVLEVLEEKEEGFFDRKDELKKLEKKWHTKLMPYDNAGYNRNKLIE